MFASSYFRKVWLIFVALLVCGLEVHGFTPSKDSPAIRGLMCDVCKTTSISLSKDVKFLLETERVWRPKDLQERIMVSCQDPQVGSGALMDACGYFLLDYHKVLEREVMSRLDEESEDFEVDIVPSKICTAMGVCHDSHVTIDQMMSNSDRKKKDLDEEREEKARMRRNKNERRKEEANDEEQVGDS
mmetsp:Transcript_52507/g.139814  ORF Transcript_52507/g.139814 Transcript_52507/m.139814 type:complete len:187 (-) Transcript_52507:6-566(-)